MLSSTNYTYNYCECGRVYVGEMCVSVSVVVLLWSSTIDTPSLATAVSFSLSSGHLRFIVLFTNCVVPEKEKEKEKERS